MQDFRKIAYRLQTTTTTTTTDRLLILGRDRNILSDIYVILRVRAEYFLLKSLKNARGGFLTLSGGLTARRRTERRFERRRPAGEHRRRGPRTERRCAAGARIDA